MKTIDKIAITLIMGSIWGAFEIFGAIGLRKLGVPHLSPFLFSFAIIAMLSAKRIGGFPGSAIIMGVLAALYKTLSLNLHACGAVSVMAVIIDASVFELYYTLTRNAIETSPLRRSILAPVIAISAYIPFAFYSAFVGGEALYGAAGLKGILAFLTTSGSWAAVLSVFAINIGYYCGEGMRRAGLGQTRLPIRYVQASGIVVLVAAWIARITA